MEELHDDSIMAFGKHKGQEMINVPASWLIWFWKENETQWRRGNLNNQKNQLMLYIEDNMEVLEMELKKKGQNVDFIRKEKRNFG